MAKAVFKVDQSPADLCFLICTGGLRQDRVVICLGHGIAQAGPVVGLIFLFDDLSVSIRMSFLHPVGERRTDVEADTGKIPLLGIGTVTLVVDLFIPVVERERASFNRDLSGEGILAGRLIKMAMYTK